MPSCLASSPEHVSPLLVPGVYGTDSNDPCLPTDISVLAPAITSLAHSQNEIGSRLGLCFTFTGRSFRNPSHEFFSDFIFRHWRVGRHTNRWRAANIAIYLLETCCFCWALHLCWPSVLYHHKVHDGSKKGNPKGVGGSIQVLFNYAFMITICLQYSTHYTTLG